MFYEEKVLAGVMYYRTHPYAAWEIMSPKQLTSKLLEARAAELAVREELVNLTEAVADHLTRN